LHESSHAVHFASEDADVVTGVSRHRHFGVIVNTFNGLDFVVFDRSGLAEAASK